MTNGCTYQWTGGPNWELLTDNCGGKCTPPPQPSPPIIGAIVGVPCDD